MDDDAVHEADTIHRNAAVAHFKGPVDFMPYCEMLYCQNRELKEKLSGTINLYCYRRNILGGCLIAGFLCTGTESTGAWLTCQ